MQDIPMLYRSAIDDSQSNIEVNVVSAGHCIGSMMVKMPTITFIYIYGHRIDRYEYKETPISTHFKPKEFELFKTRSAH